MNHTMAPAELSVGYELGADDALPEHAITVYNETHPNRPY